MKQFNHENFPSIHIQLLDGANTEQIEAFKQLLINTNDYFTAYTDHTPSTAEAKKFFTSLPTNTSASQKYMYGIFDDKKLIGFIDWIEDTPEKGTGIIGEFVLEKEYRGTDLANQLYKALEKTVSDTGTDTIELLCPVPNTVARYFFEKEDFMTKEVTKTDTYEQILFVKHI
ncbi:GNAT family N-acetyltransferase [Vagococcus jeotgali]|uniref:GNAT family N-acetyltransferase n=1 Tax=Vagococcus jeotgali TaxID=3109030 RepID=UPI002DD84113|nr:GNAT family N-acetyltransferase [Vagococcus sp. B2T-5]